MKKISCITIIAACFTLLFCSGCLSQQTAQPAVTQVVTIPATSAAPTSLPATPSARINSDYQSACRPAHGNRFSSKGNNRPATCHMRLMSGSTKTVFIIR